jgi:hypothetical protein
MERREFLAALAAAGLVRGSEAFRPAGTSAISSADRFTYTVPGISVDSFSGVVGDGSHDDTSAIQAGLNANPGKLIVFTSGKNYCADNLNVPAGTTISGYGSKISGRAGNNNNVLNLNSNSKIFGIEIDGNASNKLAGSGDDKNGGIAVIRQNQTGVIVQDCYVHNTAKHGIFVDHGTYCNIRYNKVEKAAAFSILTYWGDRNTISYNTVTVSNGQHGIMFWGYDGNNASNKGVTNLTIDHNIVHYPGNGGGANIWGTCGRYIKITNNTSDFTGTIGDINVDVEACFDVLIDRNTLTNGFNAAIAIFSPNEFAPNGYCDRVTVSNNDITYTSNASISGNEQVACIKGWGTDNRDVTSNNNTIVLTKAGVVPAYNF